MTSVVFGQWTYGMIKGVLDGSSKIAYTEKNNDGYLEMVVGDRTYSGTMKSNRPSLTLHGSYFCDDYAYIDFVLVVNGVDKKYKLIGYISRNNRIYYFDESIWTDEFIRDFKSASKCSIRVNQYPCHDNHYQFDFSGSTVAYNFITAEERLLTDELRLENRNRETEN